MRHYRKTIMCMIIFVFIFSILTAGCLSQQGNVGGTDSDSVLRVAQTFGPSNTLDPAHNWYGWYMRQAGIYQTLFSFDENMEMVPELAVGYEAVNDTAWKITLRDGVLFHDGTSMNADAVVYSINRVLNPDNSRSGQYDFIEDVYAIGDSEVMLITHEPYAPTIASLTDPIVSIISPQIDDISRKASGTGPFMLESFIPNTRLVVTKNENYWGAEPKIDRAIIEYVRDPMTRSMKLEAGEVHLADNIPGSEVARLNAKDSINILSEETPRTALMFVNTNREPLNDVRVRQAISYAINRQQVVDTALEGVGGTPAVGLFPSIFKWSGNDELEPYTHNPEKALELLKQAGIEDTSGDGLLEYNGEPFSIKITTHTGREELRPVAEVMAIQLNDIGIKSRAVILESGAVNADLNNGDFDLVLQSWGVAPTGDPDYFLNQHFASGNTYTRWTGYSNSDVDKWLELGRTTSDEDQRMEYYYNVQKQIHEDCPELFVFYYNKINGVSDNVEDYVIYPNDVTFLTENIYLKNR